MNIGIAGAGLLGRILALVLSRQGHQVSVFDPATSAQARVAAGWTAAGMLSPIAELESGDADVFDMGLRSIELWSALRSEEHTSELQSRENIVCRLLLEKKN